MNYKDWSLVGALAVTMVIAVMGLSNPAAQTVVDGSKVDVGAIANSVYNQVEQKLGSASSPSVVSGCMDVNGVKTCSFGQVLRTATNTPCIIKSPAATSTLVRSGVRIATATSTATNWHASKGTGTSEATTTANQIASIALSSGVQGTMFTAPATGETTDTVEIFAPNQLLVWTVAGTVIADSTKLNGQCTAVFQTI